MMTSTPTFFATLRYRDARKAIQWLSDVFGLERGNIHPVEGVTVDHAEMFIGSGGVMFGSMKDSDYPLQPGESSKSVGIYVAVDDADAHYERARAAGAEITLPIYDTEYGSREYTARDLEGHLWSFGTYRPAPPAQDAKLLQPGRAG